jgi:hypothetical protein
MYSETSTVVIRYTWNNILGHIDQTEQLCISRTIQTVRKYKFLCKTRIWWDGDVSANDQR